MFSIILKKCVVPKLLTIYPPHWGMGKKNKVMNMKLTQKISNIKSVQISRTRIPSSRNSSWGFKPRRDL